MFTHVQIEHEIIFNHVKLHCCYFTMKLLFLYNGPSLTSTVEWLHRSHKTTQSGMAFWGSLVRSCCLNLQVRRDESRMEHGKKLQVQDRMIHFEAVSGPGSRLTSAHTGESLWDPRGTMFSCPTRPTRTTAATPLLAENATLQPHIDNTHRDLR